jgi:hypothetical protein
LIASFLSDSSAARASDMTSKVADDGKAPTIPQLKGCF